MSDEHKNVAFDVLAASGERYPIQHAGFFVTPGVLARDVLLERRDRLADVAAPLSAAQ